MQMLAAKLLDLERQKREEEIAAITGENSPTSGFGSQIRSVCDAAIPDGEGPPDRARDRQCRCRARRGNLDPFMEAYLRWNRAEGERRRIQVIRLENVSKEYSPDSSGADQRERRHREGRIRLPRRRSPVRASPRSSGSSTARRSPQSGKVYVAGKDIVGLSSVEGAVPPSQHRLHLPGLPAAAQTHRVGERGVCARSDRASPPRDRAAGAGHPRPRWPLREVASHARRAVGWRAAARVDRSGVREPPPHPPRRRAHRKPRPRPRRSASCGCSIGSTAPAPRWSWPPTTGASSTRCAAA